MQIHSGWLTRVLREKTTEIFRVKVAIFNSVIEMTTDVA